MLGMSSCESTEDVTHGPKLLDSPPMRSLSAEIISSKKQNKTNHSLKTNSPEWLRGADRRDNNGESLFNGESFGLG